MKRLDVGLMNEMKLLKSHIDHLRTESKAVKNIVKELHKGSANAGPNANLESETNQAGERRNGSKKDYETLIFNRIFSLDSVFSTDAFSVSGMKVVVVAILKLEASRKFSFADAGKMYNVLRIALTKNVKGGIEESIV